MVNAGAIACSGLIHQVDGGGAFERIRQKLGEFAGRELAVDGRRAPVRDDQPATAIGQSPGCCAITMSSKGDVDAVLDTYFRQCAVLVTARDLAVMAATLANRGHQSGNGRPSDNATRGRAKRCRLMTSRAMYDYAGEWIYRVGMPAKSGVGGGIVRSTAFADRVGHLLAAARRSWQ